MKSKQADRYETPCKFCQFAEWTGQTQTGCSAGKLEKLPYKEVYDETSNFCVVEGLCNFYRGPDWDGGSDPLGRVRKECRVGFSLVFIVDDLNASDIEVLYHFIKEVKYPKESLQAIFAYSENYGHKKEIEDMVKKLEKKGFNYFVVQYFSDAPERIRYKEIFRRSIHPYYIKIDSKEPLRHLPLKGIDKAINVKHERAVVFCDGYHKCISLSAFLSNFQNSYEEFIVNLEDEAKKQGLYLEI